MGDDWTIDIVTDHVTVATLKGFAERGFGEMVKGVVDLELNVMAIGGELHADEEAVLLDRGSKQAALWGINLYPDQYPDAEWLEFDSMVNIRPSQGNRSRSVDDADTRDRIRSLVSRLVRSDG